MRITDFDRHALCISVATAMLTGCGGSQLPIGAPGTMAQRNTYGQQVRGTTGGALLYAVSTTNQVLVYDYPGKTLEQTLNVSSPLSACSDSSGNVFVTASGSGSQYSGVVYEYAHGGSTPIATLYEPSGTPNGCSVDPTTGNLAVANGRSAAVFLGGQGNPTYYHLKGLHNVNSCAYDADGNLAVIGITDNTQYMGLGQLSKGDNRFQIYKIKYNPPGSVASTIQYDGKQFGIVNFINGPEVQLFGVTFSGQYLRFWWEVWMRAGRHGAGHTFSPSSTWIQGNTVVASFGKDNSWIGFWKYPGGGRVQKDFDTHQGSIRAVTVSSASSR